MDTGPVIDQVEVPIRDDETAGELLDRLAVLGAPLLVDSLRALVAGAEPWPQPTDGVTLAPKISREDVALDFAASATDVARLVRSAAPAPGSHTRWNGRGLKVFRAVPVADGGAAGTIVRLDPEGPVVACGDGAVRLENVQPEGKQRMDGAAFVNGYRPEVGTRLGS
jgi:methionyl-tRNA formyltransferase